MRAEALIGAVGSASLAVVGEIKGMPTEQTLFLWSIAGTLVGAAVAGLSMSPNASKLARVMRSVLSFFAGLLIAPYVIAKFPVEGVPDWWHAFAASGLGASLVYILVAMAPDIVREIVTFWAARRTSPIVLPPPSNPRPQDPTE